MWLANETATIVKKPLWQCTITDMIFIGTLHAQYESNAHLTGIQI